MKRRGFTLLEVMITVGLIALLSALLVIGIGKLQTNAKRQQTRAILENCRAMWAEYDAVTRLRFDQFADPCPGNVTLEAERAFENSTSNGAPGDRIGFNAFVTRSLFAMMRGQPHIRAEMDKYPSNRMFLTTTTTNAGQSWYFSGTNFDPTATYYAGSQVIWIEPVSGQAGLYLCVHTPLGGPMKGVTPSDNSVWLQLSADPTVPILLDAWENPVFAIVGGQLGYISGDPTVPSSPVFVSGQPTVVVAPDHRVFFVSAGPDGDFSKGDDNLYSFEK